MSRLLICRDYALQRSYRTSADRSLVVIIGDE